MDAENPDIWADDLLGRAADANFLQRFLVSRMEERRASGVPGSFVLNVDAHWGAGKTFFLERFRHQLVESGHVVAYVDAWRDDHVDDPFISVLAAIDDALQPFIRKPGKAKAAWEAVRKSATPIAGKVLAGAAKTLVKRYVGEEVKDLLATDVENPELQAELAAGGLQTATVEIERIFDAKADELIKAFSSQAKASQEFREKLASSIDALSLQRQPPLFVLIDELDRCRPSYAVALLERVKHLFNASYVVFVFSTNTDQLQYSVAGAYGPGFDGFGYLKRFFDKTYLLRAPEPAQFVAKEIRGLDAGKVRSPAKTPAEFIAECAKAYGMNLREIKHIVDIIHSVATVWPHRHRLDLAAVLPLAVTFYRHSKLDWKQAADAIPETLDLIQRHRRSPQTGRPEAVSINLRSAFRMIRSGVGDLSKTVELSRSHGPIYEYVWGTFESEWDQYGRGSGSPLSIHATITDLIGSAGAMLERNDGKTS